MPQSPPKTAFSFGTQILIASHSIFWLAAHFIIPTLSIFFITELKGVTVTEIGISSLIFCLSFGLLEPLVGIISDRIKGLKDEIFFIVFGYTARGILFILFALATNTWHLYMFQFLLGAFRALAGPADKVLFSTYLKNRQSATLWGIDESLVNIAAAAGAGIGGYFISIYGFRLMLVATGVLTIAAGLINLPLLKSASKNTVSPKLYRRNSRLH